MARVWTEVEKKWAEMLKDDPTYEVVPMTELYPTLPEADAYDAYEERFGHPDAAIWCKLMMAHAMCEMVRDTVVLVHGTMNCNTCIRNFHSDLFGNWGHGFSHMPTTQIDKRQVVFGGEQELYEAIKAADRDYKPQLIMVFPGCATGLVQDDFNRVVENVQKEVKAKVFYYSVAGYETRPIGLVIEEVTQMWAELMDPPDKVDKDAVNILGAYREVFWPHVKGAQGKPRPYDYPSDSEEMARLIEGLGLRVHRVLFASGGDYDYVRTAPQAALNTIDCGTWGFPLARRMQEKFGTPYVYHELPLGIEATSRWLRDLAKMTGREEEAEKLIARELAAIKDTWEQCQEMVAGKTVIIGGIGNRAASYLRLIKELGGEVMYMPAYPDMGLCCDETIKAKQVDWDYFLDYGFDPLVIRLREGVPRNYRLYYLPTLMERLGLSEDDVIYMYCDFSAYAGKLDPGHIPYVNSSTHLRRRRGYPSRAVGFRGTEGLCLDIMDAIKVAKRKSAPTLYHRIYAAE